MPSVFRGGLVALLLGVLVGFAAQISDNLVPELAKATSLGVLAAAVFLGELAVRDVLRGTGWSGA